MGIAVVGRGRGRQGHGSVFRGRCGCRVLRRRSSVVPFSVTLFLPFFLFVYLKI